MNSLYLPFDQAYRVTARQRFINDLNGVELKLFVMQKIATIAGVYRSVRANDPVRGREETRFRLPNVWELRLDPQGHLEEYAPFSKLCEEAVSYFSGKFPLYEDPTYENWADLNCECYPLFVTNPGADFSCWDDLYEMLGDPEMYRPEAGFMAFALYTLFLQEAVYDDSENCQALWEAAARYYKWGVKMPWWLWIPQRDWNLDRAAYYSLLEKEGLEKAAAAFRMYWHNTGNFFLDLETENYGYGDGEGMQSLTYENVKGLIEAWEKARPIYTPACEAETEAFAHPEVYKTFVELMGRCIVPQEKDTSQKRLIAIANQLKKKAFNPDKKGKEDKDGQ